MTTRISLSLVLPARRVVLSALALAAASIYLSAASPAWAIPVSSMALWLKADAITGLSDNDPVSTWADSAGSNDATQAGANRPTYKTGILNGEPVVRFDDDGGGGANRDWLDLTSTLGMSTSHSLFFVDSTSKATSVLIGSTSPTSNYNADAGLGGAHTYNAGGSFGQVAGFNYGAFTVRTVQRGGTTTVEFFENGASDGSVAIGANNDFTVKAVGLRADLTSFSYHGDMAEILLYSTQLNSAEQIIVENYLSSKYDVTMAANDFYAGDTGGNGDYDRDVFGVGRVDASNTFATDSAAGLTISALSGLDDGEFILGGHNVVNNSISGDRWQRVWYLDATALEGDEGISLDFDFSDAGLGAPAGTFSLLYAPTSALNFASIASGTLLGDTYTFSLTGLADGYYTLGVFVPEPASALLIGFSTLGLMLGVRRRRRRS